MPDKSNKCGLFIVNGIGQPIKMKSINKDYAKISVPVYIIRCKKLPPSGRKEAKMG